MSILCIVAIYLLTAERHKVTFPLVLVGVTLLLFLFEPIYKQLSYTNIPELIANYFTKKNGSVFTIIPWLGYTTLGAALSLLFKRFHQKKWFYWAAIPSFAVVGLVLIFQSSPFFLWINAFSGIELFRLIQQNNYLFIRLGDVFVVFALFMLLRKLLTSATIIKIGASTLTIYIVHFILLYGTFTGLSLYRFFHHQLNPTIGDKWCCCIYVFKYFFIATI